MFYKFIMEDTGEIEFFSHTRAVKCKHRSDVPSCGLTKYENHHQD